MAEAKQLRWTDVVAAVGAAIGGLGMIATGILWLTGAFAGATIASQQLVGLSSDVNALRGEIKELRQQINAGPRIEQLTEINRALGELKGGLAAMDTRLRTDEERLTRAMTLIEGIDAASRAQLRR